MNATEAEVLELIKQYNKKVEEFTESVYNLLNDFHNTHCQIDVNTPAGKVCSYRFSTFIAEVSEKEIPPGFLKEFLNLKEE